MREFPGAVVPHGQTAEVPQTVAGGDQEPVLVSWQETLSPGDGLAQTVAATAALGPSEGQADTGGGAGILPPPCDDTHQVGVLVVRVVLMGNDDSTLKYQAQHMHSQNSVLDLILQMIKWL